jgi:hypothetical protein
MEGLKDDLLNTEIDMPMDADDDAPTDEDDDALDAEDDALMDAEDNAPVGALDNDAYDNERVGKSDDSDSLSSIAFHRTKNQKCKFMHTKRHVPVFKDSSDEDVEVLDMDPCLTKPTGSVGTAKTAKKAAVRLTSSVSSFFYNEHYLYSLDRLPLASRSHPPH